MKRVSASSFKARCLHLLDEVALTGEEIEVTKRGHAVARVIPVERHPSLEGSVTYLVSDEELIGPIDVEWDADRG
jgi:prevent-host-death family protein